MIRLNEPYLRQDFTDFLNNFLPDFEKDVRKTNFESLGATDEVAYLGKSKKLNLQVFELTHKVSPNARVALATDGFRIMKQSASFKALIAYRSDEAGDWRLSLMTLTPEPNEKGKVSVKFSNPRRFSFFLGPNAKINTPYNFLIKKGEVADFEDLKSRFSLEVVNKEFYQEIAELYTKLVGGVRGTGKKERRYEGVIRLPSVASGSQTNHEFAVRLIGRIIFCWFLREKKSEFGLALVPKEILSLDSAQTTKDFYHLVLEPLFFEVLNKQTKSRKEQYAKDLYAQIPYLNGGLFSPQKDDYYSFDEGKQIVNHNTVVIPDKWFIELFEVLELYNFTIDENTSVDVDLSIDPEMLGRIFENLLAEINPETGESARKSTGSYYTPRTIVEYMVDESLYQYLKQKTEIEEEKLRALSSYDLSDDESHPLTPGERKKVIEALSNITILDPACGSGAFPIGALQKIVFILQRVDPDAKLWFQKQITTTTPEVRHLIEHEFKHKNFDYIRKLGVIRKSIFGVDIQPIATEISRLRCFLTLVVDESINDDEPNRGVEPLPNLEFKFVTANSLIGLPTESNTQQQNLLGVDEESEIKELKTIMEGYFNSHNAGREKYKKRFYEVRNKLFDHALKNNSWNEKTKYLSTWDPFGHKAFSWFDPEWMFGMKDGFNIVIANPPYITYKGKQKINIDKDEVDLYTKLFQNSAEYKVNSFALFLEKGSGLLKDNGVLSYIIPSTFLQNKYLGKIRKFLLSQYSLTKILTFGSKVFKAVTDSIVLFVVNSQPNKESKTVVVRKNNLEFIPEDEQSVFNQIEWLSDEGGVIYIRTSGLARKILEKINNGSVSLGKYFEVNIGIKRAKAPILDKPRPGYKKFIVGRDLDRYKVLFDNNYILFEPKYFHTSVDESTFLKLEKILVRKTGNIIIAAYDNEQFYTDQGIYNVYSKYSSPLQLKYVLGILNSKLIDFYFKNKLITNPDVYPYIKGIHLKRMPVKNVPVDTQGGIIQIVDKILVLANSNSYLKKPEKRAQVKKYEKQIDQMVYKLYNLTPEEIEIVEK